MARPAYDGRIHRLRVTLCLREGEHDDLIAALLNVEGASRAQVVIALMRQGVGEPVGQAGEVDEEQAATDLLNMLL